MVKSQNFVTFQKMKIQHFEKPKLMKHLPGDKNIKILHENGLFICFTTLCYSAQSQPLAPGYMKPKTLTRMNSLGIMTLLWLLGWVLMLWVLYLPAVVLVSCLPCFVSRDCWIQGNVLSLSPFAPAGWTAVRLGAQDTFLLTPPSSRGMVKI